MRCLFCKEDSSSAKSIEHIIPESLGNKTFTLPRGHVCDKCNNYLAREVEKPFLEREDIRLLRLQDDIPSKKNKFPQLVGDWDGIPVEVKKEIHKGEVIPSIGMPPELLVKLILHPQDHYQMIVPAYTDILLPPQDSITSRFIGKIALEAWAHKLSSLDDSLDQLIDDKQFDPIRNHVRRGSPRIWPCHIRRIYSHHKSWVDNDGETYQILHESDFLMPGVTEHNGPEPVQAELYFIIALWGMEFAMNLGGPCIEGYQAWLQEHDKLVHCISGKTIRIETTVGFLVAFLPVFQFRTHQRNQKIVKAFTPIQLSDHFFVLVKGRHSQLLGIHRNQSASARSSCCPPHFSS